jgi:hypothetical protein
LQLRVDTFVVLLLLLLLLLLLFLQISTLAIGCLLQMPHDVLR